MPADLVTVLAAVEYGRGREVRLAQIVDALPDVSQATIRNALDGLKAEGRLQVGRGRSASWTRTDEPARGARRSD